MSVAQIKDLVRQAAESRIGDVNPVEVIAFHSALLTSFGLRAFRIAKQKLPFEAQASVELFESDHGFDFRELPRHELVLQLEAATGLGLEVCDFVLSEIEQRVLEGLQTGSEVTVERLGSMQGVGNKGIMLRLGSELRVAPPAATSISQPMR